MVKSLSQKLFQKFQLDNFFSKLGRNTSRIYILPTRIGLYFLGVVGILFLISLSYGHSLAYSATFLFFSVIIISTFVTNFNLDGVLLEKIIAEKNVLPSGEQNVSFLVKNSSWKDKFDLLILIDKEVVCRVPHLAPKKSLMVEGSISFKKRGTYQIKRAKLLTTFPFGIFFSWRYSAVSNTFYVYEVSRDSNELRGIQVLLDENAGNRSDYRSGAEEFYEYKEYQQGDSISQIDWKKFSKDDSLYVKKFIDQKSAIRSFNLIHLIEVNRDLEEEEVLRRLASQVVTKRDLISCDTNIKAFPRAIEASLEKIAGFKRDVIKIS